MKKFPTVKLIVFATLAISLGAFVAAPLATPFINIYVTGNTNREPQVGIGINPDDNRAWNLDMLGDLRLRSIASSDTAFISSDTSYIELGVDGSGPVSNTIAFTDSTITLAADDYVDCNTRFNLSQGANVASANNLVLGTDGNVFLISGSTTINGISETEYTNGSIVYLTFSGSLTVADSAAVTAPYQQINLSTGSNFSATPNDVLSLLYRANEWWEVSRTVNAD